MSRKVIQCIVFVLLLSIAGCGQGASPVVPSGPARSLEFWTSPLNLYSATPDVDRFWDVDLATIVAGPGVFGYTPGDIWDMPNMMGQPSNYCGAVSLCKSNDPQSVHDQFPWLTWLLTNHMPANLPVVVYASQGPAAAKPTCSALFEFPKCDAITLMKQPGMQVIELAVCYMVKPTGVGPAPWDIGVTINEWPANSAYFPIGGEDFPNQSKNWLWMTETDERLPDIAYDPYTGDLYLVWTVLGDPSVVNYRRYDRESETWSDAYPVHAADHHGWTPRIDVGLMDNLPAWPNETGVNTVAVAYSAFGEGEHVDGWHPCVVYWRTSDPDAAKGDNLLSAWNNVPQFNGLDSGIPVVDIGPNSNAQHYGALVFVQEMGEDINDQMRYGVYEIDSIQHGYLRIDTPPPPPALDSILPSIAVHYDSLGSPHEASLSYFAGYDASTWVPWTCRVNLDLPVNDPLKVYNSTQISFITLGDWTPYQYLQINPGLSSSIVVREDHGYWAGFCDRVDRNDDDPLKLPKMPFVAFGRTNG